LGEVHRLVARFGQPSVPDSGDRTNSKRILTLPDRFDLKTAHCRSEGQSDGHGGRDEAENQVYSD
jgi:hypothetical protein